MWYAIFAGMFAALLVGIGYLGARLGRASLALKIAGGSRGKRWLIGLLPVILLSVIGYGSLGMINTAIVIVHTLCIWLLLEGANKILEKIRGKKTEYDRFILAALVILILYFIWAWYGAHHIQATRYTVKTEKNVENLRVVQISDSHLGTTFDGEGFARAVQLVQAEDPDVVVITGDFVDDDTMKNDMVRACEALGTLRTRYGVYFVFGNHDKGYYNNQRRGYNAADLIKELEKNGVVVLEDEIVTLGEDYYLVGRQDKSEELLYGRKSMEELTSDLDDARYQIVLDHQPSDFAAQKETGVDLVLAGHTHGGQFFPINYLGELTGLNDMTYGIRRNGGTTFEVSSGISDWAIKFKTGCISEHVVLEIGQ